MLRAVELDFLQNIIMGHIKMLPEETVHLLLEYLHAVILISPVLTMQMHLANTVAFMLAEHVDSTTITKLVLDTILPQILTTFINLKHDELTKASQGPIAHAHKGRSLAKGSKGRKLIDNKAHEMAAGRKIKRFNLVTLLDQLYEAFNGNIQQDNLVEQVKSATKSYKDAFKTKSTGLAHLLSKWRISGSIEPVLVSGKADGNMGVVAIYDEDENEEFYEKNIKHLEWSKVKEPKNPYALRAVEHYQAKKQKRIEQQNQQRLEEAKKI